MIPRGFSSCLIAFCAAAAATAQTATPLPVKMGLWETSVTSKMGGMQLPPDVVARLQAMGRPVPGAPHTIVSQGCLTPSEWQKEMEQMNKPNNSDCEFTNRQYGAGKYSFDVSCKTQRGATMAGHLEMLIDDREHSHGSYHMTSDQAGSNGQPFSMDATIETHFVSADCGDVQPGAAKIIKQ
jgi:hypothetical protein